MLGIVGVTVEGCEKLSEHASEAPDLNLATLLSFASTSNETLLELRLMVSRYKRKVRHL